MQQYDPDCLCPRVELPEGHALTGQVVLTMVRLGVDAPLSLLAFDLETDGLSSLERLDMLKVAMLVLGQPEIAGRIEEARKGNK